MRKTKAFCDICKKEMDTNGIYYTVGIKSDGGLITEPLPNNIETCSVECTIKWLNGLMLKGIRERIGER